MKESRRTRRVSILIKKKLGNILSKEIFDPGVGLISISDVILSADLRIAKIYFTIIGGKKDLLKQINIVKNLSKVMRRKLTREIVLRYSPELNFIYDDTPAEAQKIEYILEKIDREKNENKYSGT